jgi:hypothetical protein
MVKKVLSTFNKLHLHTFSNKQMNNTNSLLIITYFLLKSINNNNVNIDC